MALRHVVEFSQSLRQMYVVGSILECIYILDNGLIGSQRTFKSFRILYLFATVQLIDW